MYDFIRGVLCSSSSEKAIVEAGGLGYIVHIPHDYFTKLPPTGEEVFLYLSVVIRENDQRFYGFPTAQERDIFEVFLGVSGVGPKIALAIVGHLSMAELSAAVRDHDVKVISQVPGIGKKTAERLIIEVKDKLPTLLCRSEEVQADQGALQLNNKVRDAISALMNLGYSQLMAQQAIKKALADQKEEPELSDLIALALGAVAEA